VLSSHHPSVIAITTGEVRREIGHQVCDRPCAVKLYLNLIIPQLANFSRFLPVNISKLSTNLTSQSVIAVPSLLTHVLMSLNPTSSNLTLGASQAFELETRFFSGSIGNQHFQLFAPISYC